MNIFFLPYLFDLAPFDILFASLRFVSLSGRLGGDLRQQVLKGRSVPGLSEEERRKLRRGVGELEVHLTDLSRDLTPATNQYLKLLRSLVLCE